MAKLNADYGLRLDACLLIRYVVNDQSLSLHQDNEDIMDTSHPICNITIGSTRSIEFWDSKSADDGKLVKRLLMEEGTLVTMESGCQDKLWHRVPPKVDGKKDDIRVALSFRKLNNQENETAPLTPPSAYFRAARLLSAQHSTPRTIPRIAYRFTITTITVSNNTDFEEFRYSQPFVIS